MCQTQAGPGWLVMFNHGRTTSQEYKKLVALLPRIRIGMVSPLTDVDSERGVGNQFHKMNNCTQGGL